MCGSGRWDIVTGERSVGSSSLSSNYHRPYCHVAEKRTSTAWLVPSLGTIDPIIDKSVTQPITLRPPCKSPRRAKCRGWLHDSLRQPRVCHVPSAGATEIRGKMASASLLRDCGSLTGVMRGLCGYGIPTRLRMLIVPRSFGRLKLRGRAYGAEWIPSILLASVIEGGYSYQGRKCHIAGALDRLSPLGLHNLALSHSVTFALVLVLKLLKPCLQFSPSLRANSRPKRPKPTYAPGLK